MYTHCMLRAQLSRKDKTFARRIGRLDWASHSLHPGDFALAIQLIVAVGKLVDQCIPNILLLLRNPSRHGVCQEKVEVIPGY